MVRYYSDDMKIYSVDMMLSYINNFKPKSVNIPVKDLLFNLEFKGWSDRNHVYSAVDVINNPKDYPNDVKRIKEADLSYPIILDGSTIVDGFHRTVKAMLDKKKTIKAYIFPKKLMRKFLIELNGDWEKVEKMEAYELIDLFYKRFIKK